MFHMIKRTFTQFFILCFLLFGVQNLNSSSAQANSDIIQDPLSPSTSILIARGGGRGAGVSRSVGGGRASGLSRPTGGGSNRSSSSFNRGSASSNRNSTSDFSSFKKSQPASSNTGMMNAGSNYRSNASNQNLNRDFSANNVNSRDIQNRSNTVNTANIQNRSNTVNTTDIQNRSNTYNQNNVNVNANRAYVNNDLPHGQYVAGHPNYNTYQYRNGSYYNGYYNGRAYNYPVAGIALGTAIGTLPATVATLATSGGDNYYYNEGVYYQQSGSDYVVTQPTPGLQVPSIPEGYLPVSYNDVSYYYYLGTFYVQDKSSDKYLVTAPPAGIVVPYVPEGGKEIDMAGNKLLQVSNTYYLPKQDQNAIVYQVVNPDMY